jgi:hypothetical protein
MSKKLVLLIFGLLIVILLIGIYIIFSHLNQVYIKDAYCDNNGHFNFTVVNAGPSDLNLIYKWHLDDPKANSPRPIHKPGQYTQEYYTGSGDLSIPGNSNRTVVIPLIDDPNYPMMNLVMDIELFDGNTSIYHYREQKSTYDWNYSTLPPKHV